MRLFTGIDLPAEVAASLEKLLSRLMPLVSIRWSPVANFHITTKFIGEWPESKVDELKMTLGSISRLAPFSIAIRTIGFYPNPRAPRTFWAGVEAGGDLERLARETDEAVARLGVKPEARPYSPHVTLGRIGKEPVSLDALHAAVASIAALDFGSLNVDRFFLYRSRSGAAGSVYTKLAEFKLG